MNLCEALVQVVESGWKEGDSVDVQGKPHWLLHSSTIPPKKDDTVFYNNADAGTRNLEPHRFDKKSLRKPGHLQLHKASKKEYQVHIHPEHVFVAKPKTSEDYTPTHLKMYHYDSKTIHSRPLKKLDPKDVPFHHTPVTYKEGAHWKLGSYGTKNDYFKRRKDNKHHIVDKNTGKELLVHHDNIRHVEPSSHKYRDI